jgi:hypothetical protein
MVPIRKDRFDCRRFSFIFTRRRLTVICGSCVSAILDLVFR